MDYEPVSYTDDFYQFVYDLKKTVYKKYVEACWGEWNEAVQQEMFDRFMPMTSREMSDWLLEDMARKLVEDPEGVIQSIIKADEEFEKGGF